MPKLVEAQLTADQVEKLASVGCTDDEIANVAGMSASTLRRRFDAQIKRGRAGLRQNLRAAQVRRALEGSDTMLIWLGKNYLGQRDQQRIETARDTRIVVDVDEPDDED